MGDPQAEFDISEASWTNYSKWRVANPLRRVAVEPESAPAT
jgi:hypothetical protein